jgi:hypothetical protein
MWIHNHFAHPTAGGYNLAAEDKQASMLRIFVK